METREIQPQHWNQFFNDFSRKHEGRPVGLEILGAEIGAQLQEIGLALEGITEEQDKGSDNMITIMVGANVDDHITHSVKRPTQVSLEHDDQGGDFALVIKGADGDTAILRFDSPVCRR